MPATEEFGTIPAQALLTYKTMPILQGLGGMTLKLLSIMPGLSPNPMVQLQTTLILVASSTTQVQLKLRLGL